LLARLSARAASDVFLTGRTFTAEEAEAMGLITRAVAPEDVDATVATTLEELTKGHPQGLRATKAILNRDLLASIDERGEQLARQSADLFASPAAQDGIAALMRK
jgi:enoyl-CoA hydratase/methylglutaconyl-CoA hydratase